MFERVGSQTEFKGRLVELRVEEFRHDDGGTTTREIVVHPGAVAAVAHDDDALYLVRQPREAVGEPALLELPAGTRDVEGETALGAMRRELAEEIGKRAAHWRELKAFYTTPGIASEEVTVFLATRLEDVEHEHEERLEVVTWPLADLDGAIESCRDATSLVGLMLFRDLRRAGG